MKTNSYSHIFQWLLLSLLFLSGCTKKEIEKSNTAALTKKTNLVDQSTGSIVQDDDGTRNGGYLSLTSPTRYVVDDKFSTSLNGNYRIEMKIWADQAEGYHNHLAVTVDPDFVIVGGGGRVRSMENKAQDLDVNALLTGSYPVDDNTFSTWVAESKDHEEPYYHMLVTYAVGLKVSYYSAQVGDYVDLPASTIKSLMGIAHVSAPFQNGQRLMAHSPQSLTILPLAAGGRFTWPIGQSGLLLTEIHVEPEVNGGGRGGCRGKDHAITTLGGTQEAFCLYINNVNPLNPSMPLLDFIINTGGASSGYDWVNITQNHQTLRYSGFGTPYSGSNSFMTASVAGYVTYSGFGRMLYALYPESLYTSVISSKDHLVADISGEMDIFVVKIRPVE